MRNKMVQLLRPLDAVSVENKVGNGTPDVNCTCGWIECKWLRSWPKRASTLVTLDHELLPGQKVWIRKRAKRGGNVWVVLQCGKDWLFFNGLTACTHLGTSTKQELYNMATVLTTPTDQEMIKVLKDGTQV